MAGDAALYFDPQNAEALAGRLAQVAQDKALEQELRVKSIARAALFSWNARRARPWTYMLTWCGCSGEQMNILHIYKDYYPVKGGIENHVKALAEEQARRGHAVSVLVTSRDRHTHVETINGCAAMILPRAWRRFSSAPISLAMFRLLVSGKTGHCPSPVPLSVG